MQNKKERRVRLSFLRFSDFCSAKNLGFGGSFPGGEPFRPLRREPQPPEGADAHEQRDHAEHGGARGYIIGIGDAHGIHTGADEQVSEVISEVIEQHEQAGELAGGFGVDG